MAYISSNANRWYCAQESAYGQIAAITASNRIPAVSMTAQLQRAKSQRKDKTGSRTWLGLPQGVRTQVGYDMKSYMRDWPDMTVLPPHEPLFQAALGAPGVLWPGGTPNTGTAVSSVVFTTPHGLAPGQALTSAGEIRFVAAVADPTHGGFECAVFRRRLWPAFRWVLPRPIVWRRACPAIHLFDYWDPSTAVQRVLTGAVVDQLSISLNGDFHEFEFKGMAQDIVDSASFISGQGGAVTFPPEPTVAGYSYSPVPGNLGEVWLGVIPSQFLTVSAASIEIKNNVNLRTKEFGSSLPQGIAPGTREVSVTLDLFSMDDASTEGLYQAARQQLPISVMFQLGQVGGQLMGIYLPSVVPMVPEFDDAETRLKWSFEETSRAGHGRRRNRNGVRIEMSMSQPGKAADGSIRGHARALSLSLPGSPSGGEWSC